MMSEENPKRKPNRLIGFDYSQPGAYFVTICAKEKRNLFSEIVGGGALDAPKIQLTQIGEIVNSHIQSTNCIPGIHVDKYVIMPNHIHLILVIEPNGGPSRAPAPTNALIPRAVAALKRFCNREIGENVFQRSYHDHVIRDEADYLKIWNYIDTNPAKWEKDCFFTK